MRHMHFAVFMLLAGSWAITHAQDDEKLQSGPKAGTFMPSPFECYNINGESKGRLHCFVCRFGLNPAVVIFIKAPAEEKKDEKDDKDDLKFESLKMALNKLLADKAIKKLLKQLDQTADDFQERGFGVGVVVLSPDARDSTNNAAEEKSKELVKEAVRREILIEHITKFAQNDNGDGEKAEPYKHVVVGVYPENGPEKYKLNPKAEVTVLFYQRMKIVENFSFGPEEFKEADVDRIEKRVREELPLRKKADVK